jgi:hypothetical protein
MRNWKTHPLERRQLPRGFEFLLALINNPARTKCKEAEAKAGMDKAVSTAHEMQSQQIGPCLASPRAFCDLQALAEWLERCDIRTVAMESTSVYSIPCLLS